jgi:quinol monooxygenase YgiN
MNDFVIVVDFHLKPGAKAAFRRLIDENARTSCREEPGCRRFDVLEPAGEGDRIVLYEIYDDRAAFDAHLKTRHFARFNEESGALVAAKVVTEFGLVCEGSAA